MSNIDEEVKFWKNLLDNGEIDEETYNNEISRINRKQDNKNDLKKYNISKIIKSCLPALIPVIILIVMIKMNSGNNVAKNVNYGKNLDSIPSPIQASAKGKITKKVGNSSYVLTRVASYKISGRVVCVCHYYGATVFDNISPIDIGLSWGTLARNENNKKVTWWTNDDRHLFCEYPDSNWVTKMGGSAKIDSSFSNNHIICSDRKIEEKISTIREGDFVQLTGYLVNVVCDSDDGYIYEIKTSTTRNDIGDGACEILYVTDVSWLTK